MIGIKNFSYTYPDGREALKDITFQVAKGERVAIIGANGAGKSTLLLQLNGILRGQGQIEIDGEILTDKTLGRIRKKIGLVFQDPNDQLFCPTVYDDIAFGPMHFNLNKEEISHVVKEALKKVGMEGSANRASHHLSAGEKRRASIATVLAYDPPILALDEPAAMLDPKRRKWLIEFLNSCDKTVVLTTHDLVFAIKTCKRAILMKRGRIAADGDIGKLLSDENLLKEIEVE